MSEPPITPPDHKAQELQKAFDVFNQVSQELTQAYEALQARVTSLTGELAVANGELRRQYREKEALSERLSVLLDALPAGVMVLNAKGEVTEANPVARDMFGANALGQPWEALTENRLAASESPHEWLLGGRRISIAESSLDSVGGRILVIHDITHAHDMKARLERNQRLAAMGEMAASLAHQLRTPLATALLYCGNLGTPELAPEARSRFAEKAADQLRRLERLIQDVLLFARGESIGREVIPVSALLAEAIQAVEPLMREHGVVFQASSQVDDFIIMGGRKALAGALTNLLENAMQVCEADGAAGRAVSLDAQVADGRVLIRVKDAGPGIAQEAQARIFEPFFTTRGQGTGLGLAIALGVARAHGGTIDVQSQVGVGSEFTLDLPVGKKA